MSSVPPLGISLSYRPRWRSDILSGMRELGCLEVISEHFFDCPREKLDELAELNERFVLLPHGLGLSLGTDAPLDEGCLRKTIDLVERINPPWYTEHLAFTRVPGREIGHLAPLPRTWEAVEAVCRSVAHWRAKVGIPLLLENIASIVDLPGEMSEAEFISAVLREADCGLLLDLHNLYTNARNHGYEPLVFLQALPLDRIGQIHLAGGYEEDGFWVDSHSAEVPEDVWDLLRWLAPRAQPRAMIVEWDVDLPPFSVVEGEIQKAADMLARTRT